MARINQFIVDFANWIWGMPLLVLLLGGGLYFLFYSRFIPFKYFGHAINVLRGKYDRKDDPGQINHFEGGKSRVLRPKVLTTLQMKLPNLGKAMEAL